MRKKILLDCNFNEMKDVLKHAGYIKHKKDLTKSMYQMHKLVVQGATEEEKNDLILKDEINYKKELFNYFVFYINKIAECFYDNFTYSSWDKYNNLFKQDLPKEDFLQELEKIKSLDNIGLITSIQDTSTITTIQNEVLDYFLEDAKSEVEAFNDGYGFEEPEEDNFDNEDEYLEELETYNETLTQVRNLIKRSQILD